MKRLPFDRFIGTLLYIVLKTNELLSEMLVTLLLIVTITSSVYILFYSKLPTVTVLLAETIFALMDAIWDCVYELAGNNRSFR